MSGLTGDSGTVTASAAVDGETKQMDLLRAELEIINKSLAIHSVFL